MIDELDDALRELLLRELPVKNNEVDIAFDQPKREWSARLSRPTVNLYLHDIRENVKLRREQVAYELERRPSAVVQQRPPFRVDLHYLVTTAYDSQFHHDLAQLNPQLSYSLHYEGRSINLVPLPVNPGRIARLCALALHAGYDWVHNEIDHCHASIRANSLCTVCSALAP